MRVKMLESKAGSPNGFTVEKYLKGQTYDMVKSIAAVFLREGWAELAPVEEKMVKSAAPENKMLTGGTENGESKVLNTGPEEASVDKKEVKPVRQRRG